MSGGDLMDVLVAEARVVRRRIAQGAWRRACLAPKARAAPPVQPGRR
jgi:cGMP-dependent protein kinase 2